jgi:signal transduction histidine kinase
MNHGSTETAATPEEQMEKGGFYYLPKGNGKALAEILASLGPESPVGAVVLRAAEPDRGLICAILDHSGQLVQVPQVGGDPTNLGRSQAALLQDQKDLRALTANLICAQEAENRHLARELHDLFSQKLAGMSMDLSALSAKPPRSSEALSERLRALGEQVGSLAEDVHQMSRRLHPSILEDLGLEVALKNECAAFEQQYDIPVEFRAAGEPGNCGKDVALCLYRIAQESLRNIGKHAEAASVRMTLSGSEEDVVLSIQDSGNGFSPEAMKRRGGLGMVSMEERARLVNGRFSIESAPGKGTRVEIRVPLNHGELA